MTTTIEIITPSPNLQLVEQCLPIVKNLLDGTPLNLTNIHLIIKTVMEVIEDTPVKGSYQKDLALKIIKALALELTVDDNSIVLINLIDSGSIGNIIDLVVDASKGKLNINLVIDTTVTCFKIWIPRISKAFRK